MSDCFYYGFDCVDIIKSLDLFIEMLTKTGIKNIDINDVGDTKIRLYKKSDDEVGINSIKDIKIDNSYVFAVHDISVTRDNIIYKDEYITNFIPKSKIIAQALPYKKISNEYKKLSEEDKKIVVDKIMKILNYSSSNNIDSLDSSNENFTIEYSNRYKERIKR